ncbi:MAG: SDR family oxidoreductase [Verrucomicrobiota bacterium]
MSFLQLEDRTFLVFGVANRKSVAWAVAKVLEAEGAKVIYSVRSEERRASLAKLLGDRTCYVCDVEEEGALESLAEEIGAETRIDGILHSIAFADYSDGFKPFHETGRKQFLQATQISAFSLSEIANAFKGRLAKDASVVSIGISTIELTAENYGYMGPVKAALEAVSRNLAKSFSSFSEVRFNTVNSGPLKTSASAGIPGYMNNYLYAEKMTLRKRALATDEVADTAVFLLSPRSSGINGQGIVVNAGMDTNYFDKELVERTMRGDAV